MIVRPIDTYAQDIEQDIQYDGETIDLVQTDIDSIGDVWVFIIDKSASMIKGVYSYEDYAKAICAGIQKEGILRMPNYQHDHFYIYTSGLYDRVHISNGQIVSRLMKDILRQDNPFSKIFIHPVNGRQNLQYITRKQEGLKIHLQEELQRPNYDWGYSFTLLMRPLSLQTLKSQRQDMPFRHIYLVTITDEDDINDQWRKNYTDLQAWDAKDKKRMKEVSGVFNSLIYNELSHQGAGSLKEIRHCSVKPATTKINIWVHQYDTRQSQTQPLRLPKDFISLKTNQKCPIQISLTDGTYLCQSPDDKKTKIVIDHRTYHSDENNYQFLKIDSIRINNQVNPISRYVDSLLYVNIQYDNVLHSRNNFTIYGEVQVAYEDSIFGKQYKKYPVEYSNTLLSPKQSTAASWAIAIFTILALVLIIYYFFVRPHYQLLRIIVPDGSEEYIRRGFAVQWHEDVTTIARTDLNTKQNNSRTIFNHLPMSKIVRNLDATFSPSTDLRSRNKMLLVSSRHLTLSTNAIECNTLQDIEGEFNLRQRDYVSLLENEYKKTIQYHFYDKMRLSNHQWWYRWLLTIVNIFTPRYYCIVDLMHSASFTISHNALPMKLLQVDIAPVKQTQLGSFNISIEQIVEDYYIEPLNPPADILVRYSVGNTYVRWYVVALTGKRWQLTSMRQARLLLCYDQYFNDSAPTIPLLQQLAKRIIKQMHREGLRGKIHIAPFQLDTSKQPMPLQLSQSTYLSFLSIVEDTEQQHSTHIYSPFADGETNKKTILLRKSGHLAHLYSSLLPFNRCRDIQNIRLSEQLIQNDSRNDRSAQLNISNSQLEFLGIRISNTIQ